jgi:L-alanine-DL-glutamate epimerase-like enolase superfamily enzyme
LRIVGVDLVPVRIPLARPYTLSRGRVESFRNVLVRVHGQDGRIGLGECDVLSVSGDAEAAFRELRAMAGRILDVDALDIELVVERLGDLAGADLGPLAAFDIACWDLNGQELGQAVHTLLGGRHQASIPVDFTVGEDSPERMAALAGRMRLEGGFSGFCVKVGGHGAIELDVARVRAVREAIGPEPRLRADANGAFDLDTADRLLRALEPYDLEFIEQPLPATDLDGLVRLAARTGTPISIDEGLRTPAEAERLVATGAVGVLNIKIPKCGGLFLSRRIAATADAAGLAWLCGGGLAFEVVRQAARHFVAAAPRLAGYHHEGPGPASQGLLADIARPVVGYADVLANGGRVLVHDSPGLGLEEDREAVARLGEDAVSFRLA